MYVKWRALFGLALAFWVLLCAYDKYYINPATKTFYYEEADIDKWEEEKLRHEKLKESENHLSFGVSLILCNVFTFFCTVFVCITVKYSMSFLERFKASLLKRNQYLLKPCQDATLSNEDVEIKKSSTSCSKIPVYISSKASSVHSLDEVNTEKDKEMINSCISLLSNSSSSFDVDFLQSKSETTSRLEKQIERRCSLLRDEMLLQQSKSLKEHATLSRRLEVVSRERRDLARQLMLVQKENQSAKQQLDQVLTEKELLVKRLDCASKEFKVNTNSKKVALAKLDEAHATISEMKTQLELTSKEKEALEKQIKLLDSEHQYVKKCLVEKQESRSLGKVSSEPTSKHAALVDASPGNTNLVSSQQKSCFEEIPKHQVIPREIKKLNLSEITQSQQDVEKVQQRLINLEKSLNKLKLSNLTKNADLDKRKIEKYETAFESETSTETELVKPRMEDLILELQIESFKQTAVEILTSRSDNLTDEQRRNILGPFESSGDELLGATDFENLLDYTIEDPFDRVGMVRSNYSETTSTEYDTDGYRRVTKRMVSNSPAFQKFLRKMDHTEYRNKMPMLTNAF